jgi:DNA repair exonuclease SbcCD ATPase subunit
LAKEEAYDQAAEVLASVLRDSGNTQGLALKLKAAADNLAHMSSALIGEEKAGSEVGATLEQIAQLEAKLSGHETKRSRLSAAMMPITACSDRFESNEVANKVIAENAAEIARVFNAIHAPNDFTVRLAVDDISIVRNGTQTVASISEMSSGQRAAYALSLYFAMNSRLSSGPPLLLLDDPIAHVDDLNVLSFLDHLRDLVIDGKRQIFFSTANEKLAGLFRQKFRFMGEQDFRDIRIDRGD